MTDVVVRPAVRPTYGIDAPNIVIGLAAAAVLLLLVGFFMAAGRGPSWGAGPWALATLLAIGAAWTARGTIHVKPRLWRDALDGLQLRGDERALDLGCGRGLVLIEAAKRLPEGHATGVDIWRNRDQSGNRRITTELNVQIEGMTDRVTIHDADMTRLPFPAAAFDLVTASFSLRCLARADEREQAVAQIARVLRPGGRVLVLDDRHTAELAESLRAAGFEAVTRSGRHLGFGRPARMVTATHA